MHILAARLRPSNTSATPAQPHPPRGKPDKLKPYRPSARRDLLHYESNNQWEVLLEDTEDIELHIESLVQGTLKTEVIPLGRLPKRGEYSMRLQIETLFLDEKTCKITVRDVGFGEFFPPTDFQEEKMIHLGGNDGKFNSMS